jgi:hypothetical protein
MPFNGSGTFNRLYSWIIDAANNVDISSSRTDAEMNGFAAGLTNCLTRDGQSPPSADIPWGGKRLTNLGAATTDTDALSRITGDGRYILASVTSLSVTGSITAGTSLNAATLALSGNSTVGGSITATGNINTAGNAVLTANAMGFFWKDASGSQPHMTCQADNNLVLYGTDGTGASRSIFSVPMRSSGNFSFLVSAAGLTPATNDNSTLLATTAYVQANITGLAPLLSPTFTGSPAAPTPTAGDSSTKIATTAFVATAKNPSVQPVSSAATVTPTFSNDLVDITAQAVGLTLANPTGTAVNGWGVVIRIKDNGTPQTIAYGTQYVAIGISKPTTTVAGKVLNLGMIYNANLTRWEIVSAAQE